METIIIEIVLGCTGEIEEFMLPAHVPLVSLLQDIAMLIEQVDPNAAFDKDHLLLYDLDHSALLQSEWTLAQNGVRDGSRLMIL